MLVISVIIDAIVSRSTRAVIVVTTVIDIIECVIIVIDLLIMTTISCFSSIR